jgi:hypothetical protein
MANVTNIKTPHAAVIVWNYSDRIGTEGITNKPDSSGVDDLNGVEQTIISTLSCISIETSKSKGQPEGQFRLVLAPYKNWVSTITAGSWCCLMMSNEPITEQDLKKANKNHVKMIGKIESVRVDTKQTDDTRQTQYFVAGVDWGHIFNNIVYVDNLIAGANDPQSQGNAAAVALRNALFGKGGTPKSFNVDDNLRSVIGIFGQKLGGFTQVEKDVNRLAKAIYNFKIPKKMVEFFDFSSPSGKIKGNIDSINKVLNLKTGVLTGPDVYKPSNEAKGFINPFSLQGQHTFWQILMENSNPALNEMFPEMRWRNDGGLELTIYNRIKPFAFKGYKGGAGSSSNLQSYFQNLKTHQIDNDTVISINAGSNWRDKYNFIEIKPEFQDFNIIANWYKQKSQVYDPVAFEREGFRPLILETKQFPSAGAKPGADDTVAVDWNQLEVWAKTMREWYFNTHRMLNGTLVMQGTTNYIGVGDNIKFDVGLINPTPNINKSTVDKKKNQSVLAHVESISHSFAINGDARTYITTIQFVRGIIVEGDNVISGRGTLDKFASSILDNDDRNTVNTISTSTDSDPDQKVRGR